MKALCQCLVLNCKEIGDVFNLRKKCTLSVDPRSNRLVDLRLKPFFRMFVCIRCHKIPSLMKVCMKIVVYEMVVSCIFSFPTNFSTIIEREIIINLSYVPFVACKCFQFGLVRRFCLICKELYKFLQA